VSRLNDARREIEAWREAQATKHQRRALTPDLFDPNPEGLAEHHQSVTPGWATKALEAVRRAALRCDSLTIDDVDWPADHGADRRSRGSIMRAAAHKGWLEASGWVGGGSERHARPIRIWASRIYRERPR
jgi:hypothetical protein